MIAESLIGIYVLTISTVKEQQSKSDDAPVLYIMISFNVLSFYGNRVVSEITENKTT
jgi:hypothetical protein